MIQSLNALAKEIHSTAKMKGFWDNPRDPLSVLMLVVSEAVEAGEDYRDGKELNAYHYREDGKPEGIPSELADIIIRVLDACGAWDIDIERALKEKMAYNLIRPTLHGRER